MVMNKAATWVLGAIVVGAASFAVHAQTTLERQRALMNALLYSGTDGYVWTRNAALPANGSWQVGGGGGGVSDGDKGDITVTGGGATWTIDPATVTLAKMADIATARFVGRTTAGTGAPEALTATQATALLDAFTSGAKGLAPASGGGTANFLRADGTWASPSGGGGGLDHQQIMRRVSYGF
jgi:hypothetical protein